jgi:aspartyl/asparaginyl beta-hydroxylase (cupin superfamily)/thioredoxin-like negative regulator of GroEL
MAPLRPVDRVRAGTNMTDRMIERLLMVAFSAQKAGQPREAKAAFHQILHHDPDHAVALNSLGVQYLAEGDATQAVRLTERATQIDPNEPILWLNLARAQREAGDIDGERSSLDAALALDPTRFMSLLRRAQLLQRLGEVGEAGRMWSGALASAPPLEQQPPALAAELAAGRDYLERQGRAFGAEVDATLSDVRGTIDDAERRRFDACVDQMLGRRRVFLPNCAGVYFPFLPADEFFERHHFPWMPAFEAATAAIRAEATALVTGNDEGAGAAGFRPYVDQPANTPRNIWSGLDKRLDWSAYYFHRFGTRDEDACARCPKTAAALAQVPLLDIAGRGPTAFFSLLKPKTKIPPHSGVTNTRTIVHLPIIVPRDCGFRVGGETRAWREGEAFGFDDTIEHEAWNDSNDPRLVLICDVWNPYLSEAERTLLRAYFETIDRSAHRPDMPAGL